MNPINHAFAENSVIGTCLKLAHATFYDALPSNAQQRGPTAPPTLPGGKRAPVVSLLQRWAEAFDNWSYRQRVKEREAYLAQSQDVFDLEDRVRRLERHPQF